MESLHYYPGLKKLCADNLSLGHFFLQAQAAELEITEAELLGRMQETLFVMREAISYGLSGVRSTGGLVGGNGLKYRKYHVSTNKAQGLLGPLSAKATSYALAANEANAAMGKICAAPTAGSSGILPAVLFAIAEERYIPRDELAMALIVAGAIGMVIASRASLSGSGRRLPGRVRISSRHGSRSGCKLAWRNSQTSRSCHCLSLEKLVGFGLRSSCRPGGSSLRQAQCRRRYDRLAIG